jgi:Icc-related predicted phosphoesterase
MKILCISDRVEQFLYGPSLNTYAADVEAVVACGDLPFTYLEYIITFLGVPVYYVLGNHDPAADSKEFPGGCTPLDGKLVDLGGVMLAGLSGSSLYSYGPNQYSEGQMCLRAYGLSMKIWRKRLFGDRTPVVFVTHSAPYGLGDREDRAHVGFESFVDLIERHQPKLWLHGHVHLYGPNDHRETRFKDTQILNVYGHRILEL